MDNIGIREKFGGKTAITVYYAGSDEPDYFDLTEQNGRAWLGLALSHDRRITRAIAKEIRPLSGSAVGTTQSGNPGLKSKRIPKHETHH